MKSFPKSRGDPAHRQGKWLFPAVLGGLRPIATADHHVLLTPFVVLYQKRRIVELNPIRR
jgi:hypothetical protein